jgi:hypothetical protein
MCNVSCFVSIPDGPGLARPEQIHRQGRAGPIHFHSPYRSLEEWRCMKVERVASVNIVIDLVCCCRGHVLCDVEVDES